MSLEYRALRDEEEEAVLSLWTEVFGVGRPYFERYLWADPSRRTEHTRVAVDVSGQLVSAVHICLRDVRDADGAPQRVGCVANVATREPARRQGHSGRLLEQAIRVMEDEGCAWSLLGTGTHRHYARYGWRQKPTSFRYGELLPRPSHPTDKCWTVRRLDLAAEPEGWESLARVYDAYNAARPLTVVRSLAYWRGFGSRPFTNAAAPVLVAEPVGQASGPLGYLALRIEREAIVLQEVGTLPGAGEAVAALLSAAAELAVENDKMTVRAYLPSTAEIETTLAAIVESLRLGESANSMVRSIAAEFSEGRIDAAFDRPGAIFWRADGF